jgi:hypothetical protein
MDYAHSSKLGAEKDEWLLQTGWLLQSHIFSDC